MINVLEDLYDSTYDPDISKLPGVIDRNGSLAADTQAQARMVDELRRVMASPTVTPDVRVPLTPEEAKVVDAQIAEMLKLVHATIERVDTIEAFTTEQASLAGQPAFKVSVEKKESLKKALRKMFGSTDGVITLQMYRQALDARASLEKTDAQEYLET